MVVAAGSTVLLHGCTLPANSLTVNSITVQAGATVSSRNSVGSSLAAATAAAVPDEHCKAALSPGTGVAAAPCCGCVQCHNSNNAHLPEQLVEPSCLMPWHASAAQLCIATAGAMYRMPHVADCIEQPLQLTPFFATVCLCVACVTHLQLIIGDSLLTLSFKTLLVNGTFRMGTPSCPITSRITVMVPGGAEEYGMDVGGASASFDVHGAMQVRQELAAAGHMLNCSAVCCCKG